MRQAERLVRHGEDSRGRYPGNNMWGEVGVGVVRRSQPVNPLPFSPFPGGGVAGRSTTERIANPVISGASDDWIYVDGYPPLKR